jgi:hypothetical protein
MKFRLRDMKNIVCPISNEKVNENITRLNALFGILLVIGGFLFNSPLLFIIVTADFFIRAFTRARFSPISYVSHLFSNALHLPEKSTDKAPKIFAARLGFLMTTALSILMLTGQTTAAMIVGGVLVFFASLEFVLALCMGCLIYTYVILPFYK